MIWEAVFHWNFIKSNDTFYGKNHSLTFVLYTIMMIYNAMLEDEFFNSIAWFGLVYTFIKKMRKWRFSSVSC